jgi:hypothetical protein
MMRVLPIRSRWVMLTVMLIAALLGRHLGVAAATPETSSDWSEWLGTPGPEECTTEPITADEFVYAVATAIAQPQPEPIPIEVASIDDLPSGEPASAEETASALDTVREVIACVNAGSFGRALALFTPNGMGQLLLGTSAESTPLTEEELLQSIEFLKPILETPATPVPVEQRAALIEIQDVRKLPDGRMLVVSVGDAASGNGVAFAVLSKVGDRWLIDAAGTIGQPATPTPGA